MKKHTYYLFAILLFAQFTWAADVDSSTSLTAYYATANGLSSDEEDNLRKELCAIISANYSMTSYSDLKYKMYASSYSPTDFVNGTNKSLEDIYSSKAYIVSEGGSTASTCGVGWNKEHTVPKSYFDGASPMYSDAFHIYPTDIYMNSLRNNYPYGETNAAQGCSEYGYGRLGKSTFEGYSGTVFDPGEGGENGSYKGDLARSYFYMVTRYRNVNFTLSLGAVSFTYSDEVADLTPYMCALMLKWHRDDPVSEKEMNRNNAVYAHQRNRNPFIDYPELVEYIWGDKKGQPVTITALDSPYANETPLETGIDVQRDNVPCTKVIRDGQLYLMYEGQMYNVQGQKVK